MSKKLAQTNFREHWTKRSKQKTQQTWIGIKEEKAQVLMESG